MNPKYHISLELAKRLAPYLKNRKTECYLWCWKSGGVSILRWKPDKSHKDRCDEYYKAANATELLEWLPGIIDRDNGHFHLRLLKRRVSTTTEPYYIYYEDCEDDCNVFYHIQAGTLAEALGLMLEYLYKKGLI